MYLNTYTQYICKTHFTYSINPHKEIQIVIREVILQLHYEINMDDCMFSYMQLLEEPATDCPLIITHYPLPLAQIFVIFWRGLA